MKLESERLLLLPLRPEELRLLCFDLPELERRLNISYQSEPVEGVFSEIIRNQLEICERRPESYLWTASGSFCAGRTGSRWARRTLRLLRMNRAGWKSAMVWARPSGARAI